MGAFDIPQPNPAVPSSCSLPLVLAVSKQRQAAAVQSNPDRANRDPRDWLRGISSQAIVYRYSEAGWCVWRRLCPQSLDARARGFPITLAPSIAYTACACHASPARALLSRHNDAQRRPGQTSEGAAFLEHSRSSPARRPASLSAYVLSCCCNASCKAIARDTALLESRSSIQLSVSCMV